MKALIPHFLSRIPGQVLAYLAYAAVMAAAGCGLWLIGEREY
jgi:hypothetical protein